MPLPLYLFRLLPIACVTGAAMAWVYHVEGEDAYALRNMLPMLVFLLLAAWTLRRGRGRWRDAGWRWLLGTAGFAVPSIGLSLYLHYGYLADLDGMFSEAVYPLAVFRFLPLYTLFAGGIGFAIGWIAGRNVDQQG